jgi:hypothetical protein
MLAKFKNNFNVDFIPPWLIRQSRSIIEKKVDNPLKRLFICRIQKKLMNLFRTLFKNHFQNYI